MKAQELVTDEIAQSGGELAIVRTKPEPKVHKKQLHELFGLKLFESAERKMLYTPVTASPEEKQKISDAISILFQLDAITESPAVIQTRHNQDYFEISMKDAKRLRSFPERHQKIISSGRDLGELTKSLATLEAFGKKQKEEKSKAFGRDMESHTR